MVNFRDFDSKATEAIPSEIHMISGCHDSQTSADVSNVGNFKLPNPQGRSGGACTAALLSTLYECNRNGTLGTLSWVDLLRSMRTNLLNKGFDQVPQLTSSRLIDVTKPFKMINDNSYGTKRAVLIGINYTGQQGELSGCHNDVKNMKEYLTNIHGFKENNMTILMDDGRHINPTRVNITKAYRDLVRFTLPGDTVFAHYSGHGGRVADTSGDEDDGYDETLIPVDFKRSGQITDDELFRDLVKPMPSKVLMTSLMDCCHSGTVLDLPYRFTADGDVSQGMQRQQDFSFDDLVVGAFACCFCVELIECLLAIIN